MHVRVCVCVCMSAPGRWAASRILTCTRCYRETRRSHTLPDSPAPSRLSRILSTATVSKVRGNFLHQVEMIKPLTFRRPTMTQCLSADTLQPFPFKYGAVREVKRQAIKEKILWLTPHAGSSGFFSLAWAQTPKVKGQLRGRLICTLFSTITSEMTARSHRVLKKSLQLTLTFSALWYSVQSFICSFSSKTRSNRNLSEIDSYERTKRTLNKRALCATETLMTAEPEHKEIHLSEQKANTWTGGGSVGVLRSGARRVQVQPAASCGLQNFQYWLFLTLPS